MKEIYKEHYYTIEKAIRYIENNHLQQPSLDDISQAVNLSKYHFQRLFKEWAGISPGDFLHYITFNHAKEMLKENDLLQTSLKLGLSSPSRLNDLFIKIEAVTPGEYKKKGEGLTVVYGFADTPFGTALLAHTDRGLSNLIFCEKNGETEALRELQHIWSRAEFKEDSTKAREAVRQIFKIGDPIEKERPLSLHLRGTEFQLKVWKGLLNIPQGNLISYGHLAQKIGSPKAARAVGSALANNPLAYIIPCHRVIRESGIINNYRWGSARKKIIIGWEQAIKEQEKLESGKSESQKNRRKK